MLYGSETWPIKVEESQRLHRNDVNDSMDVQCNHEV